jgi:polar amino acid transport system ATP-binding protein
MSDFNYIIKTEHLYKYFGSLEVLKDINIAVKMGEVICIIGPSAAGKFNIFDSPYTVEKITSGKIIKDELFSSQGHNRTLHTVEPQKQKAIDLEMEWSFSGSFCFRIKPFLRM